MSGKHHEDEYDSGDETNHIAAETMSGCGCAMAGCKERAACVCGGCKVAAYCSAEHQAMDWASHHVECNLNVSSKLHICAGRRF